MKRYIGTKIILAEPMEEHDFALRNGREIPVQIDASGHSRPGYKVDYEDGYVSWSPKETFERAYREITRAEIALIRKGE